ncbi:MAG: hypothetical protein PHU06_14255 [Gallionella sp.]|nr:hypothetical protein [Gallionella sp.]MDD4960528.1 hypothetical protein [Gallionella sp.]
MLISSLTKRHQRAYFMLFIVGVILGIPQSARSCVSAEFDTEMLDPIFSVGYEPDKAHFERLETKILLPSCKRSLSDLNPLPRELTLYAKYENASVRIYLVVEADNQKILVIRNASCHGGPALLTIMQTHSSNGMLPDLTDAEVVGLFEDSLERHARAFGGKDNFLKWLDMRTENARVNCKGLPDVWCPPTFYSLQPVLQEALKNYRKTP